MHGRRWLKWFGIEEWSSTARTYLALVGVGGVLIGAWSWFWTLTNLSELTHEHWNAAHWLLLAVLIASVAGLSIKILGTKGVITVSDTFLFASAFLFGPVPTVAIAWLDGFLGTLGMTRKPASLFFSSSMMAISILISASLSHEIAAWLSVQSMGAEVTHALIIIFTTAGMHFWISTLSVSWMLSLRGAGTLLEVWRRDALLTALTYASGAIGAVLIVVLIQRVGISAFFLVSPLILGIYWSYRIYSNKLLEYNAKLEDIVATRTADLRMANTRLRELDRMKTEFLNVVAHDLRTPLTSIMAYAQLMVLHPEKTENFGRFSKVIFEESKRLREIINNVLDLSKIEAGKMRYTMKPLALMSILSHLHELFHSMASSHRVELVLKVDDQLPAVLGDEARLSQVVSNLISNALKFSESGGVVVLQAQKWESNQNPLVRVEIQDQGPGIPEEEQERIFQKFHTIQRNTHQVKQGTGLGLPIAQEIILNHGGQIGVDSVLDEGSTFWFTLPALPTESLVSETDQKEAETAARPAEQVQE